MYATFRLLIINHTECASHTGSFVEIYTGGRLVDFRVSTDGSVSHINRCLCSLRSTREHNEERMAELLKKKRNPTTQQQPLGFFVLILQLANSWLFCACKIPTKCVNILKGEVSVLEKEYKARCITAQYFLPASSRNGSWGDWRREPRVSTPLNEHIYQFSRDVVDYQHLDKHTHTRSRAI